MSVVALVARARKRLDTVDIAWGIGFVLVAWSCVIQASSANNLLVALLVSIWGLRLSLHIGRRSLRSERDDPRYVELSKKWRGSFWVRAYGSIFLLQGFLIFVINMPVLLLAGSTTQGISWISITGSVVWLVGFTSEAVADRQLKNFLQQPKRGKIMQEGLWRYSRHPNYFGELMQWWGIGIIACQVAYGWLGLIGPLLLTWLIVFVSGVPPIEKRHENDAAYQAYRKRTSMLVPLPPRQGLT